MSRDELIKQLADAEDFDDLRARLDRTEAKLDLILSVIVVQQKNASLAAGVASKTIRNKVLRGETEILRRDGSSLNFLTLQTVSELKPRRTQKRKK